MAEFTETNLWRISLSSQIASDPAPSSRERLRAAYLLFREHAGLLAGEIARSLPEFTVHDVTHLDALWEMADLIAGPDFSLSPAEAFVLGGAFLIHDLGNGLAAYPGGVDSLKSDPSWLDTVAVLLRRQLGRAPSEEELRSPDPSVQQEAIRQILRNLHAKQAEQLAQVSWQDQRSENQYYLIDDVNLRQTYGPIIGKIAHSHWWEIDQLRQAFDVPPLGAPAGYPRDWTVDLLKVACLVRVADASHLDARRAPRFLMVLRQPSSMARSHWEFQAHLHQPQLQDNQLVYTSGRAFPLEDAPAWWLCFDTLQMVDRELRQVDNLLIESNRPRLQARGVKGVDDPKRLVKLIPTNNWLPFDARIKVTDVATLVRNLGGEQLYGHDITVPLRELIQNASDAVRARRFVEGRDNNYGEVCVRFGQDNEGYWVEVADNGVGMSTDVLTGAFLDFGNSFWGSAQMIKEFPGLLSKGFESTGKYGIGFFSVFMWGERVRVTTRSYKDAPRDTQVLVFSSGLTSRPILRKAWDSEFLRDGGTCVRVWLKNYPGPFARSFPSPNQENPQTIKELCAWLCPSLDVNLYVQCGRGKRQLAVGASDWIQLEGTEFLRRLCMPESLRSPNSEQPQRWRNFQQLIAEWSANLRIMKDSSGKVVGRACITKVPVGLVGDFDGIVTVGGFRSSVLSGIIGVLVGTSQRAARDVAIPVVEKATLVEWATDQAKIVSNVIKDQEDLQDCADFIRRCLGYTGKLPIAFSSHGWISMEDMLNWKDSPEIFLVQFVTLRSFLTNRRGELKLNANVIVAHRQTSSLLRSHRFVSWPEEKGWGRLFECRQGIVLEGLAKIWGCSPGDLDKMTSLHTGQFSVVEIGLYEGQPVRVEAEIIKNPRSL